MINNNIKVSNSSLIDSFEYDSQTQTLTITYKGQSDEWTYSPVSQSQYDQVFNSSGSIGSKFIKQIRNRIRGKRSND